MQSYDELKRAYPASVQLQGRSDLSCSNPEMLLAFPMFLIKMTRKLSRGIRGKSMISRKTFVCFDRVGSNSVTALIERSVPFWDYESFFFFSRLITSARERE